MDLYSIPLSVVFKIAILSGSVGAFVAVFSEPLFRSFFKIAYAWSSLLLHPLFWGLARRSLTRYPMSQIRRRLALRKKARAHRIAD